MPQDFEFAPLTEDVADSIRDRFQPVPLDGEDKFYYLTTQLAACASECSKLGPVAYIEAELFGGTGHQGSMVWRDGRVVRDPHREESTGHGKPRPQAEWPINAALREIGVWTTGASDEFDSIGLGSHRSTDEWLL
jgi:hypothetical protein